MVTFSASGVHWSKFSIFFVIYISSLFFGLISSAVCFWLHHWKKTVAMCIFRIQRCSIAFAWQHISFKSTPKCLHCLHWGCGREDLIDAFSVQGPRSRPSQIWYQLDKQGSHQHIVIPVTESVSGKTKIKKLGPKPRYKPRYLMCYAFRRDIVSNYWPITDP